MKILTLNKPLMVDGNSVVDLQYDFEQLTAKDLNSIPTIMNSNGCILTTVDPIFDPTYNFFLFAKAVEVTSNNKITVADVNRLNVKDSVIARGLARDFLASTALAEAENSED